MIKLLYKGEKELTFQMTNNPITNPQQSQMPEGKHVNDLDPSSPGYEAQKHKITSHPNYSESTTVILKPGINEFKNEEHAEYLYKILGNPEVGGSIPLKTGEKIIVENNNILFEVDDEGNEVRDNLFKKYRMPVGVLHVS